ncbi:peptide deformylase [Nonomuraea sp. MG754425]|uniref:peptide deformylase n=1 Tax=Nonomuraea sp. MG754425 TaxID=2570319 RepID=UPI001F013C16|nr:peptide deformylase [Nonomuraea sp. MG754425]MCF6476356.1 peptide deformylase [Nonomuraea sp. MG754425]
MPDAPPTTRPITLVGTPVLHRPCRAVEHFDDDLARLVETMFASMYSARGVGLAANQVGVDLRVFVYDCPDEDRVFHKGVVVNPILRLPGRRDRRLDDDREGCLSVPGCSAPLPRPDRAVCDGFDVTGAPVTVHGTGLLARCLQHETDHLDGLLYIDRLPAAARRAVLAEHDQRQNAPA